MINLSRLNPFNPTVKATTEIVDLRVYPIKSCRGISLASAQLTRKGLEFDRNWMFITAKDNKFATIRKIPKLTLVDTSFTTSSDQPATNLQENDLQLVISIRDQPENRVSIPARPSAAHLSEHTVLEQVEIWDAATDAYVYAGHVNDMISSFIGKEVKLCYKGPTPRIVRGNGAPSYLGRTESMNFPDMMPVLIANTASIDELNTRLKDRGHKPITIERFRPNIVIHGGEAKDLPAWCEDSWKAVRVVTQPAQSGTFFTTGPSALDLDVQARCARCGVPNVDPETGVKDGREPWSTLLTYRKIDKGLPSKPCFGMLACPRVQGEVRQAMVFEIVEKTERHFLIQSHK